MTRYRVRTTIVCAALLAASLLLFASVHVAAQTDASSGSGPADAAEGEGQSNEDIEQEREANAVAAHPFLELHGILNGSWFKVRRVHRHTLRNEQGG
jgi:hypothetical protein